MNRIDWNKLSPDEFERLQEYISCKLFVMSFSNRFLSFARRWKHYLDAPRKVKDAVAILEQDPTWLLHKHNEVNCISD